MAWKPETWKFSFRSIRDRWLFLLALGILLLFLSAPAGTSRETEVLTEETEKPLEEAAVSSQKPELAYEQTLEMRLKELLQQVEGVGQADVMIVLKSRGEKVWQADTSASVSVTEEKDAGGGSRKVEDRVSSSEVVLAGKTGAEEPVLQKELSPEISGVIVSAEGGGSPSVQADISQAVEALFGLPAHKVKVLKRTSP